MTAVERIGRRKSEAAEGLRLAAGLALAESADAKHLGGLIAGLARGGADKVTLLFSRGAVELARPIAGLLAQAPVVPVLDEPLGKKQQYGNDRLFISISQEGEAHDVSHLAESGHTVLQWRARPDELQQWEAALKVVKELLGPAQPPERFDLPLALEQDGLQLFAAEPHAQILRKAARTLGEKAAASPVSWLAAHLALAGEGDFIALLHEPPQPELQRAVREKTRLACTSFPVFSEHGLAISFNTGLLPERAVRLEGATALNSFQEALKLI